MRTIVVGLGYVGLTTAAGLADTGHDVVGVERDQARLASLRAGLSPVYEPGLQELVDRAVGSGRLGFTSAIELCPGDIDAAVITVDTPPNASGSADVSNVEAALRDVFARRPSLVVNRSTIPPGTSEALLRGAADPGLFRDRYVLSPEFFNQGTAIADWRRPARTVAGAWNPAAVSMLQELLHHNDSPWVRTSPTNAEMIKYASNAFLAVKISFANEIANLCDLFGATIDPVIEGMGLDSRIGKEFWRPGLGYGDSCLPKDVSALIAGAVRAGYPARLLAATQEVNEAQHAYPLRLIDAALGPACRDYGQITVLGLCYEPHSDDIRAAPSRSLIPELARRATKLHVWDPLLPPDSVAALFPEAVYHEDALEAVTGAGIAVVLTEYPELRELDWASAAGLMAGPRLVVDAKNCLDGHALRAAGLGYRGVGRPDPVTRQGFSTLDGG